MSVSAALRTLGAVWRREAVLTAHSESARPLLGSGSTLLQLGPRCSPFWLL